MAKAFNVQKKRRTNTLPAEEASLQNSIKEEQDKRIEAVFKTDLINTEDEVKLIPLVDLIPNPYNDRTYYCEETVKERAESLKKIGQVQPILVTINEDDPTKYTIIDGEYRFRGAKESGLSHLKAIELVVTSELELYQLSRESNKERKSSSFFDQAMAYQRLLGNKVFLSQKDMAEKEGLTETKASQIMSLCEMPNEAKSLLATKITDIPLTTAYEAYKLWKAMGDDEAFLDYCQRDIIDKRVGRESIIKKRERISLKGKNQPKPPPYMTFRNEKNRKIGELKAKGNKISLSINGKNKEHTNEILEKIGEFISELNP